MSDTAGLIYDTMNAIRFASVTAGIDEATAKIIITARDRYQVGLEIQPEEMLDGERAADIRAKYPALFSPDHIARRFVSPPFERAFIVGETGIDEALVHRVLDADHEYTRRRGIVD